VFEPGEAEDLENFRPGGVDDRTGAESDAASRDELSAMLAA
jgi:hypothetical protein